MYLVDLDCCDSRFFYFGEVLLSGFEEFRNGKNLAVRSLYVD